MLVTRGRGYVLRAAQGEVDADRFRRLVSEARDKLSAGDPGSAGAALREALGLWRGAPLAEFASESFAKGEITRLEEARLAALEDRIEADLALGEHAVLVGELQALVYEHPLRERLRGQLMLALFRAGRQSDALAVYRELSRLLREELGLEPSSRLRALELAILQRDPSVEPRSGVTRRSVTILLADLEGCGEVSEQRRHVRDDAFERHKWSSATL